MSFVFGHNGGVNSDVTRLCFLSAMKNGETGKQKTRILFFFVIFMLLFFLFFQSFNSTGKSSGTSSCFLSNNSIW